jgi:uncharacterized repeat protein (TIGR03803 family)
MEDKPMQSKGQSRSSLFRTISLAIIAALLMAVAMVPAWAQSSVPPTAVQAAKMPEFARRLAHPVKPQASRKAPARNHRGPRDDNEIYDNGPTNGNTDAWTINFGFVTSDSFNVGNDNSSVTGMSFAAWLDPGDILGSVEVSITSSENGGTSYFDQTVNFTQSNCVGNDYGYYVCTETTSFNGPTLNTGTYWVNLQNASVPSGDPVYWDENSGPSQASQNDIGTIPSESFTILGSATTITCASLPVKEEAPVAKPKGEPAHPSPAQTFNVIYNFTGGVDGGGPAGLTVGADGNLYGVAGGGDAGQGTVFKLTPEGSSWRFTRLYSFSGRDGSGPDSPPVVASDGTVYGTTGAGGAYGNGVLFGLRPSREVLPAVFSNWTERLLYSFTGGSDGEGPGGSLVLDHSGNVYGTASGGGATGGGTVYEFTNGAIQVLHAFPAFPGDGSGPQGAVSGAGGLYGITATGGAYGGGTVYTLAGGYNILANFGSQNGGNESGWPLYMAADQAGNLYLSDTWGDLINGCYWLWYGYTFELTYPDWTDVPLIDWNLEGPLSAWVTPDASGNVYGTAIAGVGEVFKLTCCWTYTTLHTFSGPDGSNPNSAPVVDAQGNVYGVTRQGGAYGNGVVWEISP